MCVCVYVCVCTFMCVCSANLSRINVCDQRCARRLKLGVRVRACVRVCVYVCCCAECYIFIGYSAIQRFVASMSLNADTNIHCLSLSVTHVPARSRACMRAFSLCLSVTLSFFPSHSFFLCLTLFLSHSHLPTKSLHLHTHTRVGGMTLACGSTDSRWMWQRTATHSKTQCIVLCDGQRTVHCSI